MNAGMKLATIWACWITVAMAGSLLAGDDPPSGDPPSDPASGLLLFPPLRRPLDTPPPTEPAAPRQSDTLLQTPTSPPLGFAGPSGVLPREEQQSDHFVPMEDRWRIGFPEWDRYGKGHPPLDDYPYVEGTWWDPFNQNVLKGDYPIIGQHTFLEITGVLDTLVEGRDLPTPAHNFDSYNRPFEYEFFGRPSQFFATQNVALTVDLFHGDAGFKPVDWRVLIMPVFNFNYLDVNEVGIVSPNVTAGTSRARTFTALEEYFVETKISDTSPYYDFVSVRVGSQPFTSDFRGFIFSDVNRGVRLFGTRLSDRDEFNVVYFRQAEKDTNSELNTFNDRGQDVFIANYYREDFLFPGYTAEASIHFNHDQASFHFDKNGFLVRPDPAGVAMPHEVNVVYLGLAGDGHIGPINVSDAFYWALGHDTLNPIAGTPQDINAQMAAIELSKDRDWVRFRTSFFFASGDENLNNRHATGFDAILDNPNFAGGGFSFWQREAIGLFGVNLVNRNSLLPDLRSSKLEGQSNFVNPGLLLANVGIDFELTPKLKMINNLNFLWFDKTQVLEQFVYQGDIHHFIGVDPSMGFEYRPLLSNNAIVTFGVSALLPGRGFRDIYDTITNDVNPLFAGFVEMNLKF